ncbi:hypothetical protein GH714_000658 [Hevea brasiliensis]|uniref:Cytochrome P450 n=1 Tax=Hevea brasiliensis TaxID=3981 RepID=A0A6A6M645_HEVBR|nr:hypothetical protein GH714_000658 [Hevea brasiliensis]
MGFSILDSDTWRAQRRIFTLCLEKEVRACCRDQFEAEDLTGSISSSGNFSDEVDLQDVFQRFTFDNICQLVIGFDPNSLSVEFPQIPYQKAFDDFARAGKDSVGAALVWIFWVVATHPDVEQKILEEIKANLGAETGEQWRVFSIEEVRKLVYLHAVICEVLRLYPPVPFEHKVSIEEDTLPSGHKVPRNMRILFSLYSMGRLEEIWGKDCLEFKPERWISEGEESNKCLLTSS